MGGRPGSRSWRGDVPGNGRVAAGNTGAAVVCVRNTLPGAVLA